MKKKDSCFFPHKTCNCYSLYYAGEASANKNYRSLSTTGTASWINSSYDVAGFGA
jgi:hypothetical protein